MATYQGLDVDHPRIVEAIRVLAGQRKTPEQIAKVVGMPYEVVQKHLRETPKGK